MFFQLLVTKCWIFFFIIKPSRCTNFSNLFWKWNSTCFGQFLCPSSGVIHCTLSNGICHTCLLTTTEQQQQQQQQFHPDPAWQLATDLYDISSLSVQWITPDDGQRNCLKHAEFRFQNKFEKLVRLVGFIIKKFVTMHGHMNLKKKTKCWIWDGEVCWLGSIHASGVTAWPCSFSSVHKPVKLTNTYLWTNRCYVQGCPVWLLVRCVELWQK
jgi:hypothetical protein